MTYSIFYDLETTGIEPIGQILNFCFRVVDENWKEVDTFYAPIRIHRLELPAAKAIEVTRTDVLEHQKRDDLLSEHEAMFDIRAFLLKYTDHTVDKIPLIGFNSNRFDLNFLRTSMIRNGVSPYFANSLLYRDLLHLTQRLTTVDDKFLAKIQGSHIDSLMSFSLRLSRLLKVFKINERDQTHDSFDDVLDTIEYAKFLDEEFGADIRDYNAYEVGTHEVSGLVVKKAFPRFYDEDGNYIKRNLKTISPPTYMTLLEEKGNYSLWVDLKQYKKSPGKDAIYWCNAKTSQFFLDGIVENDKIEAYGEKVRAELIGRVTLDNYFPDKKCDIEQFIYAMHFRDLDELNTVLWNDVPAKVLHCKFAKTLWLRWWMKQGELTDTKKKFLKKYARHRYGGKMSLGRKDPSEIHPTIKTLINDIKHEHEIGNDETKRLMKSLMKFYKESDIYQVLRES